MCPPPSHIKKQLQSSSELYLGSIIINLSSAALLMAYQACFIGKTLWTHNTNKRLCEEMISIDMTSTKPVALKSSATEVTWNGILSCFMATTYSTKKLVLSKSGIYTMKGPTVSSFGSNCTLSRCCQHTIITSLTFLNIILLETVQCVLSDVLTPFSLVLQLSLPEVLMPDVKVFLTDKTFHGFSDSACRKKSVNTSCTQRVWVSSVGCWCVHGNQIYSRIFCHSRNKTQTFSCFPLLCVLTWGTLASTAGQNPLHHLAAKWIPNHPFCNACPPFAQL